MEFYFLGFIILIFLIGIYLKSTENISDPFFREDGKFELRVSRWFLFGLISPSLMIVFSIYQYLEKVKNGEGWVLIILAVGVLILAVLESLNKKIVYGDSFIEKTNIFNKKSKIELGLISNVKKKLWVHYE